MLKPYNSLQLSPLFIDYLFSVNSSRATVVNYLCDLGHFVDWTFANTKVNLSNSLLVHRKADILLDCIKDYLNYIASRKTSNVRRKKFFLKKFFNFLLDLELISPIIYSQCLALIASNDQEEKTTDFINSFSEEILNITRNKDDVNFHISIVSELLKGSI